MQLSICYADTLGLQHASRVAVVHAHSEYDGHYVALTRQMSSFAVRPHV